MMDAREPKDGDFVTYVENLVRLPTAQGMQPPSSVATPERGDTAKDRASQSAWGHAGGMQAGIERLPEPVRKVLEAKDGNAAKQVLQAVLQARRASAAKSRSQAGQSHADPSDSASRTIGQVATIATILGIALIALSFAPDAPFFADPVLGITLLVAGAIARRLSRKLA